MAILYLIPLILHLNIQILYLIIGILCDKYMALYNIVMSYYIKMSEFDIILKDLTFWH